MNGENAGRDVFELLAARRQSGPKSQKRIAEYILESLSKACFLTAARLGESVGVSESTVVRFAAELGYDGYPAFQMALQDAARNKLTATERIEVLNRRLGDGEVLKSVLENDISHISKTIEETKESDFEAAVTSIINAKKIYIMGTRSSGALASFMGYYFRLMLPNVILIRPGSQSEIYEQLMRMESADLLIGISFPRYAKQTVNALAFAKDIGADSLAITDSMDSPIAANAGRVLLARSDMVSFVDSLVAPLSLINALIVAVSIKKRESVAAEFGRLERIWDEYDVFEKGDGPDGLGRGGVGGV